ncbi:MAG: ATP synthase F1 subunit gamma [Proteobacteria bacterium]|nr:ATP synthase F1 subunit gamma [Pseudomonadota bacterium]
MPNLKDIKRRIGSVKNTQKITHAMKLVSAAKFARANHAVVSARPYGVAFEDMVGRVVVAAGEKAATPLTTPRGSFKRTLLVIVSTDRGLCGGLNSNLFKMVNRDVRDMEQAGIKVDVITWGRRATSFAKKIKLTSLGEREKATDKPKYDGAKVLAKDLVDKFLANNYDDVKIAFVEFKSALSQVPTIKNLLPVVSTEKKNLADAGQLQPVLEPEPTAFLGSIIRRQVEGVVFRTLLEATASEHGARMTAMDSATKNAKDVIRKLTLQYNRGRQAAITKELIEITSGADAL